MSFSNFCLPEKIYLCFNSEEDWSIECFRFKLFVCLLVFTFRTLNISCYFLLICKFSAEKWTDSLMGFPLYLIRCFSLGAFKILSLTFAILNIERLGVNLFEFVLFEISLCLCFLFEASWFCAFWTWMYVSFPKIGKHSAFISSGMFPVLYSFSSSVTLQGKH